MMCEGNESKAERSKERETSVVFLFLHISCFGVIPKNNQPGKWHLNLDLSSPEGKV